MELPSDESDPKAADATRPLSSEPPKADPLAAMDLPRKALRDTPLPAAIVAALEGAAIFGWRKMYRDHRLGKAQGAEGEGAQLVDSGEDGTARPPSRTDLRQLACTNDNDEDDDGEGPDDRWEQLERAQALITEYRLAYRRHRVGGAMGAKGELGDLVRGLDAKALRLLPAAQVANLRTAKAAMVDDLTTSGLADERFHVHFGAGRLGLGLIIPAVAHSGAPFAVVQRPSKEFMPLLQQPAAPLSTGGDGGGAPGVEAAAEVVMTVNGAGYPGSSLALVGCRADLPPAWDKWLSSRASQAQELVQRHRARAQRRQTLQTAKNRDGNGGGGPEGEDKDEAGEGDGVPAGGAFQGLPQPPELAPRGLFVCSTDPELLALVNAAASSFSTSLGPGLANLAKALAPAPADPSGGGTPSETAEAAAYCKPRGLRQALFAGENDHGAVDKLAAALEGHVDVVSCMVDRICTGRTIKCEAKPEAKPEAEGEAEASSAVGGGGEAPSGPLVRSVDVSTEEHPGGVVVLTPPPWVPTPPLSGDHVLVPRANAEADYLCRRKLLLVNGMHTTIAFLSLARHCAQGQAPGQGLTVEKLKLEKDKLVKPHSDLPLVTLAGFGQNGRPDDAATASEAEEATVWAWAVARLLVLIFEWDMEVIKSAHGVATDSEAVEVLVSFATDTLVRLSKTPDTCGRILGGGVQARFEGRLKQVKTFLDDVKMRGGGEASGREGQAVKAAEAQFKADAQAAAIKRAEAEAAKGYTWSHMGEEVAVVVPLPEGCSGKRDVQVLCKPKHLTVKVKGEAVLSGDLTQKVEADEMSYTLEKGALHLLLIKSKKVLPWPSLFQAEADALADEKAARKARLDGAKLQAARKEKERLAKRSVAEVLLERCGVGLQELKREVDGLTNTAALLAGLGAGGGGQGEGALKPQAIPDDLKPLGLGKSPQKKPAAARPRIKSPQKKPRA